MSALGWLALAAAVLVIGAPSALPTRVLALAGAARISRAGMPAPARAWRPGRRLVAPGAFVAAAASAAVIGPVLAVALAVVVGVAALLVRDLAQGRLAAEQHAQLLGAVRLLVAELDAGSRPANALQGAADVAPSYADVLGAAARCAEAGDDPGAVLAAGDRTRLIGIAWQAGEQTGAPLAGVLAHIARDLGAVDEQRRAVGVALSGPRASAAVLTALPMIGIALGAAMGAHPLPFLIGSGAGRVVCAIGVALDAAGVLWMRRLVQRAQAVP